MANRLQVYANEVESITKKLAGSMRAQICVAACSCATDEQLKSGAVAQALGMFLHRMPMPPKVHPRSALAWALSDVASDLSATYRSALEENDRLRAEVARLTAKLKPRRARAGVKRRGKWRGKA